LTLQKLTKSQLTYCWDWLIVESVWLIVESDLLLRVTYSTDLLLRVFWGLGALFGGTKPPKAPRGDGTCWKLVIFGDRAIILQRHVHYICRRSEPVDHKIPGELMKRHILASTQKNFNKRTFCRYSTIGCHAFLSLKRKNEPVKNWHTRQTIRPENQDFAFILLHKIAAQQKRLFLCYYCSLDKTESIF